MSTEGAGSIAKAGLPEDSQVEEPFHKYHEGRVPHGVPCNEAAFGTWQQAVRKSGSDTASIQVDDLAVLTTGKDHTPAKGVAAPVVDQPYVERQIERIAEGSQMAT